MADPRVSNHHNVYILGAGFSRAAGFPLMHDFMIKMRECLRWLEATTPERSDEAKAVRDVLRFRLEAAGAAYRAQIDVDNIEELFSLSSALNAEALDRAMTSAIAATLDYAAQCDPTILMMVRLKIPLTVAESVNVVDRDERPGSDGYLFAKLDLYAAQAAVFASALCPGSGHENTVISFNYDTLLEAALGRAGVGFSYCLDETPPDCLHILKLHGSVNWAQHASFTVHDDYLGVRTAERIPVLVPPTWRRKYGSLPYGKQLDRTWSCAVEAIESATNIVIVGFSAPSTDVHFRYLLSAGLKKNISLRSIKVVNPDVSESLRARVLRVLRPELETRGILEFVKQDAVAYLLDPENLQEIGRALAAGKPQDVSDVNR